MASPMDAVNTAAGAAADASSAGEPPGAGDLLAGYPTVPLDEAVDDTGAVRAPYRPVLEVLQSTGLNGIRSAVDVLDRHRAASGITFIADVAGELVEQPFPLDPVPRLLSADDWSAIEAGVRQRTRALNAFLADVYAADRGRPDAGDGEPADIVRAGLMPASVITSCPGHLPAAADLAPGRAARATVLGFDLVHGPDGAWRVLEDNLRVPSGLGYAVANRRTATAALPMLHPWPGLRSPEGTGADLLTALRAARPPRCPRDVAEVAVLSDGPGNSAWFEHQLLAELMGVPVVTPADLHGDERGVRATVDGQPRPIDVLYRRLGDDEIAVVPDDPDVVALPAATRELLVAASRAGTLGLANAPGTGVADDKALYAFVPTMIHFYLGETPAIADVGTWVLSDPAQYAGVRDRLAELVVKPVDGSGGAGVMIGPEMTTADRRRMREVVDAAPERFIAQEVIRFSTHPTVRSEGLRPRHVDLRVFALDGSTARPGDGPPDGSAIVVPPVALSRVALESEGLVVNSSRGGGSKDTWLIADS